MSGWGDQGWGSGGWGGGVTPGLIDFLDAVAIAENVVRVQFDEAVYLDGLFGPKDAGATDKWSIAPTEGSKGVDGEPGRAVSVVSVRRPLDGEGVAEADLERFACLILDRPLTSFPSTYSLTWTDVWDAQGLIAISGSSTFAGLHRLVNQPTLEDPQPSRDIANAFTPSGIVEAVGSAIMGTFAVGSDGDYATDSGVESFRKRLIRRLVSKPGAWAHMPKYGAGIVSRMKQAVSATELGKLQVLATEQAYLEPDTAEAKVLIAEDPAAPGLVRVRIAARQKGTNQSVGFAFATRR